MQAFPAGVGLSLLALSVGADATPARAAGAYCAGDPSRRAAQKIPAELAPTVAKAFDIGLDQVGDGAFVRCVGPRLMACWIGANLDCDKADARRTLPGATAYCRQNPGSDNIPMAATGHDTIYDWRCVGPRAVAGKIVMPVDAQGYIADNWKALR